MPVERQVRRLVVADAEDVVGRGPQLAVAGPAVQLRPAALVGVVGVGERAALVVGQVMGRVPHAGAVAEDVARAAKGAGFAEIAAHILALRESA